MHAHDMETSICDTVCCFVETNPELIEICATSVADMLQAGKSKNVDF